MWRAGHDSAPSSASTDAGGGAPAETSTAQQMPASPFNLNSYQVLHPIPVAHVGLMGVKLALV
jgi:hypothetical protein